MGKFIGDLPRPRAEGERAYDQVNVEANEVMINLRRAAEALAAQPGGGSAAREAQQIADGALAEALARLREMIGSDYVPALGEQAKVTRAPDAPDYFRELARLRVSEDLSLSETHHQARDRLAVIDADLARLRRRLGGAADAVAFHRAMIGDPRWYVRSADELKARLEAAIAQVTPLAPRYFRAMPKTPFGVAPLPEALQTRLLNGLFGRQAPPRRVGPTCTTAHGWTSATGPGPSRSSRTSSCPATICRRPSSSNRRPCRLIASACSSRPMWRGGANMLAS